LTLATDLLKPGGYLRLTQLAEIIGKLQIPQKIDTAALDALAAKSLAPEYSIKEKRWHGTKQVHVDEPLPLTDCYIAPCKIACPIGQDAPEYIKLTSEKRYRDAVEL
ncbi:MAG: putative selenate reductase subunit YgfK, partial [Gammaproteobacteria bacterium]|nr:putative selenate reductase subunit YgfK [Gammaproteobacteria bacterium]